MIFALDFDGTYTEDPHLWIPFIDLLKMRGHSVTFVTFRDDAGGYDNSDIFDAAKRNNIDVVFTKGQQKAEVFKADIWIDDMPQLIPSGDTLAMYQWITKMQNSNAIPNRNGWVEG